MNDSAQQRTISQTGDILPSGSSAAAATAVVLTPTPAGQAALATAQALAKQAAAPATLRAYKADWTHFADWCTAHGFVPVPAAPTTVDAYLGRGSESADFGLQRRAEAAGVEEPDFGGEMVSAGGL